MLRVLRVVKRRLAVSSEAEINRLVTSIRRAANQSKLVLRDLIESNDSISLLSHLKFRQCGRDPLDADRPLNLVEQLNQSFTYLASLEASRILLRKGLATSLTLNLSTAPGSDIEASDLAAEVFAATHPGSNQKLRKDYDKVRAINVKRRFVFFSCPGIERGPYQPEKYPEAEVISLGEMV